MDFESAREEALYAEYDIGNLCTFNVVELKPESNRVGEAWLKNLATVGAQCLLNKIWELPRESHSDVPVVKLPEPTIIIPREKPLPKRKPPTKWDLFAKKKQITKKKKEKLVWNENSKEWKPQYGYRSAKNDKSDWLIEVPDNADPNVDYFAKKKDKKSEDVAKNEYQRLRNIAAANKTKVSNLESMEKANKEQLLQALSTAKAATASLGKFTKKLPKEKAPKNNMKKRKFTANIPSNANTEKENNLKILDDLNKKKPKLDIKEAVEVHTTKKQAGQKNQQKQKKKKKPTKTTKPGWKSYNKGKKKFQKKHKP